MRIGTLTTVVCSVVLALAGVAAAEKVKTNQSAELFSRPGEASHVLTRIKEGQAMTVLSREGRWIKVRVKGRTGYVPRSKVEETRDDEIKRNTRRRPFVDGRSTERGWAGGAPEDRVGADAVRDDDDRDDSDDDRGDKDDDRGDKDDDRGDKDDRDDRDDRDDSGDKDDRDDDRGDRDDRDDRDDRGDKDDDNDEDERPVVKVKIKRVALHDRPNKSSDEVGTAHRGDTFFFMREDRGWVMVENDEGDAGWIKSSAVAKEGSGGGVRGGRQITGLAGAGVKLLGQTLRTPGGGTTAPDNYTLGTSAATIEIGVEVLYPYGSQYVLGGSLDYAGSKAVPGIAYMGSTIGMTIHDVDLRAIAGYDLKNEKGMVAYGRLGYHFEKLGIASVSDFTKNTAMIPSEIFKGPVVGAGLDVAHLSGKLALRVTLDTVVFGSHRSQTKNLEDGASPSSKGAWVTGCLIYRWKNNMTINGAYELTYMKTNFGAQAVNSMRHMGATGNTTRTDLNHTVTVLMARSF